MASIGATEAKVTPIITGSRMPTPGSPSDLHQRGDAAGEQVGIDQDRHLLRRQAQGPPDDQRHRDSAGVHDQHVLQAEREKARIWENFVYRVYGL